jgi:hypothetical protein
MPHQTGRSLRSPTTTTPGSKDVEQIEFSVGTRTKPGRSQEANFATTQQQGM